MNSINKYLSASILTVIIAAIGFWIWYFTATWYHGIYPEIIHISIQLGDFIENNNGKFPQNEQELISQNYLEKNRRNDGHGYYLPKHRHYPLHFYPERIQINYGVDFNDLAVDNGDLISKTTNKPISLISSNHPLCDPNSGICREVSLSLYERYSKDN